MILYDFFKTDSLQPQSVPIRLTDAACLVSKASDYRINRTGDSSPSGAFNGDVPLYFLPDSIEQVGYPVIVVAPVLMTIKELSLLSDDLKGVIEELEKVAGYGAGWGGDDWDAPNPVAVEHARALIQEIYTTSKSSGIEMPLPLVSANPYGDIALEWWCKPKALTIYIRPDAVDYVCSWGPHFFNDMEDGPVANPIDLIRWLNDATTGSPSRS